MEADAISVVIPTRNDEGVFRAIDSVLAQAPAPGEVVVVDGSDGDHRAAVEEHCAENGVTYVDERQHDTAASLDASRNLGIAEAGGDAVALLDGDCEAADGWLAGLADALDENAVVEAKVTYSGAGRVCPMDRAVENRGQEFRFLGAGLAFRREVWEEREFREDLGFHGDTAFGFDALENWYGYGFAGDAEVLHHAGRFSATGFVRERLRFEDTPRFVEIFRGHDHVGDEVPHLGPLLFPRELLFLAALAASLILPFRVATVPALLAAGTGAYVARQRDRDLDICPLDLLMLLVLVPLALLAKRWAIWRGAVKYNVFVL